MASFDKKYQELSTGLANLSQASLQLQEGSNTLNNINSLNALSEQMNQIQQLASELQSTTANIDATITQLSQNNADGSLDQTIAKLQAISDAQHQMLGSLPTNLPDFSPLIAGTHAVNDGVNQTVAAISQLNQGAAALNEQGKPL